VISPATSTSLRQLEIPQQDTIKYTPKIFWVNLLPHDALFLNTSHSSNPDIVMWDLWWIKWRWGRFSPSYFGLPCQSLFHQFLHTITITYIIRGWYNRPVS
jgi:hypothetical protein